MIARRSLLLSASAMAAVGLGACSAMPAAEPGGDAGLLTHLMALETGSWQHVLDRDVAGMQAFLAEDALLIFGDGSRFTKAEFLKAVPGFGLRAFTIGPNPQLLRFAPDVAAIVYTVSYSSGPAGAAPTTLTVTASSTFARRGGRWVSVHYQETPAR